MLSNHNNSNNNFNNNFNNSNNDNNKKMEQQEQWVILLNINFQRKKHHLNKTTNNTKTMKVNI